MKNRLLLVVAALLMGTAILNAGETLRGQYVEARTCDVWVGACFANAEMNVTGKHAVLAWKIDKGAHNDVNLDGLSVVAVVEATDTLGLKQTGPAKAVLIVDEKANTVQREALVDLAKKLGGDLTKNILSVEAKPISVNMKCCEEGGCVRVEAGVARIETRCIHKEEDSVCGHEANFYPPLTQGVEAKAAMIMENTYNGKAFNKTWTDQQRRGAYIGSFSVN